ncbi:MAG: PD-(D/E)XK nuclease family protein [Oscillospiraceae bacterium]|nr:PD-(D/E)XK nuclease family protein [Oscillospiraceae bacterium]
MLKIITSLSYEKSIEYLTTGLNKDNSAVLIVPEQFLFETERGMYKRLGARKIGTVNITGFSKLAAEIIKKHGEPKLYADDIIKSVTMYKTLSRLNPQLTYYKGMTGVHVAQRMLRLAGDFKSAGITAPALRKATFINNGALQSKLSDITEIYSAYCESLESEFADKLDDNKKAAELISIHDYFKGIDVYIYEFDSFSESQLNLMNAIIASANNVNVVLRTDSRLSEKREFYAMNTLIKRLEQDNDSEFINIKSESNNPETEYWTADDVYSESEFVAAKIHKLITEDGYSMNDIAVLVCNPETTGKLKNAFADYGITAFTDLPEPIIKKPMTRFIITALEATTLETDKLMSYIRSGFVRVSSDLERPVIQGKLKIGKSKQQLSISYAKGGTRFTKRLSKRNMDKLEQASFIYGLTKKEWAKPFPESNKDLARLEPFRAEIVGELIKLREQAHDTTGDIITQSVCRFLLDTMQLQRTVIGLCHTNQHFTAKNHTEEFRQLWDIIIEIFESLNAALKGFTISLSDYTELLKMFFTSTNIAKPPQVIDAVTVGDPERTRLNKVGVVFITGATLGIFPRTSSQDNEFSIKELEELSQQGLKIISKREERYNFERFIVNKAMTLPTQLLYITAPLRDSAWNELRPSPLYNGVDNVKSTTGLPLSFWVRTLKTAQRTYVENINNVNADIIKQALKKEPVMPIIRDYLHRLTPETAERLFDYDKFSPTRLETLMNCRFRFFCRYGLGITVPVAQNDEEPVAMERGNIIHHCLDEALKMYKTTPDAFKNYTDEDYNNLAERFIADYRNTKLPSGYAQTKRQQYILAGFKTGIVRMLKHIRDDFENSKFTPHEFERGMDFKIGNVIITGKIDRVDIFNDNGNEYVRVVDYKSGTKEMDFPAVFNGLEMQMLLYLFAVCENGAKPVSALYMPADGSKIEGSLDPDSNSLTPDTSKARMNWLTAHIPSGITIQDNQPAYSDITEQENRYRAESKSSSKKAFFKVTRLTPASYDKLKVYCGKLINVQVNRVKKGEIEAIPLEKACTYCEYSASCNNRGERRVKPINRTGIERII